MQPLKSSVLVHLATLFNVHRSMETGKLAYYKTYIDRVRLLTTSSTVQTSTQGWTRVVTLSLLVDPKTTQAYARVDGRKEKKTYLPFSEWDVSPEKEKHWTLRDGSDWLLVNTEKKVEYAVQTEAEIMALNPRKIERIETVINKNGKIHHWQVHLV